MMFSQTVLYYGCEDRPPEGIALRAGPLSMRFEPGLGFLRYVRLGSREILRGVYVAVRDQNWDTIAPRVSNLEVDREADAFRVRFEVTCREREVDFFWRGSLTGDSDGTVVYRMDGEARSTFYRNRIGFCVLHTPAECAGHPCCVEKDDGTVESGTFPDLISPHQPFMDMRAISHEVAPGLEAEVRFEGDLFEMEDQRNWTDASYKTYCTPLAIPFPVEVREGTSVVQSVRVSLKGEAPGAGVEAPGGGSDVLLTVDGGSAVALPDIGLGMASHGGALSEREVERLKALHPAHLRADLKLSEFGWQEALKRAAGDAEALGVSLEAALFLSGAAGAELEALVGELERVRPQVARWLVFHVLEMSTTEAWVTLARRVLQGYDPKAVVGGGTNAYFTELNRERPPVGAVDLVCYSLNPQVHAFDNASMAETLQGQAWTVESARHFVGDLPLAVTPVTLKARFNPNATGPESEPKPGELPSQVDVRQMSLFGAGWTLGSLKYLCQSGIQSVTYYETTGSQGVMETEAGSPAPDTFRSIPGGGCSRSMWC